jgi:hypothetical protein
MHAVFLVLALAAAADQTTSPRADDLADPHVERVRAALDKPPPKLTLTEVKPDFKVHIEVRRPLQEIFDTPPWQLPPIGWRPPAVAHTAFGGIPILNVDLLALGGAIARSVNDARRAHDARDASEDVRRAIAEYCAAQPNAARIQICSSSPAIR